MREDFRTFTFFHFPFYMPQGPGPPQRPHMPGGDEDLFLDDSDATAKTLSSREVFVEPHLGQGCFSSLFETATSFSNFVSQLLQMYS